jgi:hypothetical protein
MVTSSDRLRRVKRDSLDLAISGQTLSCLVTAAVSTLEDSHHDSAMFAMLIAVTFEDVIYILREDADSRSLNARFSGL